MLISRILNHSLPSVSATDLGLMVTNDLVGVEIEVERMRERNVQGWNVVREDSIDNGIEFVLTHPLSGEALTNALYDVDGVIKEEGGRFSGCTSVHVHVNVLDMELEQFMNYLTLLVMLEKVLYRYVDRSRTSNHFCWAFGDCEQLVESVSQVYQSRTRDTDRIRSTMRQRFSVDSCKYAGINLSAVPRYGSLELRMHHGTSEAIDIIRWINILLSIKAYAMADGRTPANILDHKINNGIPSIFRDILGEQYSTLLEYEGIEQDILYGIRLAQDFVYSITQLANNNHAHSRVPEGLGGTYLADFIRGCNNNVVTDEGRDYASN